VLKIAGRSSRLHNEEFRVPCSLLIVQRWGLLQFRQRLHVSGDNHPFASGQFIAEAIGFTEST
jgi:hypothetical protein